MPIHPWTQAQKIKAYNENWVKRGAPKKPKNHPWVYGAALRERKRKEFIQKEKENGRSVD